MPDGASRASERPSPGVYLHTVLNLHDVLWLVFRGVKAPTPLRRDVAICSADYHFEGKWGYMYHAIF